jgi:bacterioferritin-associated ferredoxin
VTGNIVTDTHALLLGYLQGEDKRVIVTTCAGGKKRYATIIAKPLTATMSVITASIFGNEIVRSTPDELVLDSHGYRTGSTRDSILALTTVDSLWSENKRWVLRFDGFDGKAALFNDRIAFWTTDQWVRADELRAGDAADLEHDLFAATPCSADCGDCEARISQFEFEYQQVSEVDTANGTTSVEFCDGESFAFPSDHLIRLHERGPSLRQHMQGAPEVEVDTPFGPLWLQPTGADSILVNCNSNGRFVTVNRCEVAFLAHWWLQPDGSWSDIPAGHAGRAVPNGGTVNSPLIITRKNWTKMSQQLAPNGVYRKVREVIPTVVREWAETPIGMHWLRHAQEARVNNGALMIEEQINDLTGQVDAKKRELADLLGKDVSEIKEALRG